MVTLDTKSVVKILVLIFIGVIVFFPWPSSSSYGEISGFDPGNLFIQSNPNFVVQLNSSQIGVKSAGPGVEAIHLALSDLPYIASFNVTVRNQTAYSYPLKVVISFPLNLNQISLLFSSDQFIYFELNSPNGSIAENYRLIKYSIGQPINIVTQISTFQTSKEFISIYVSNQTTSSTANLSSEVYSLLRDQSRLISIEVTGTNILAPDYFALNDNQTWSVENFGDGLGNFSLVGSDGFFSEKEGSFSQTYLMHSFLSPVNLSQFDAMVLTFNGSGTNGLFRVWVNTDWNNRVFFYVKDDFNGPKRMIFVLSNPDDKVGTLNLDSIEAIGIDFPHVLGNWSIGDVNIGRAEKLEGATFITVSNFSIDILPHSLAYAPLTPLFIPLAILLSICFVIVLMVFFSSLKITAKNIFEKLKLAKISKICLFTLTFAFIFVVYFVLFGIGDHAFDIFSQKVWSYDIAKYGLLSLFQRPAITSAAYVFGDVATQHAIFPYGPLAGLYYYVIGQTYFLFSSNPSVYDQFFTSVVKSFQTLATLGCGLVVFKLVRRYGSSFRSSFLTMLLFLLNPLILYDAAVWGHQDSVLIFFLLLSLWAYESNHPKTSYFSVALAVLVKSTGFAPALLMIFLLVRKFGFREVIDGILTGLATGVAIILPYVSLGASPIMLFNDTVTRVFQFGTLAFQYPRSAAVSPDGYNIWPLFTYFTGAHGRDRMWYPDFAAPFFGISYLLAGELIFVSFSLVLIFLATKKRARSPGAAALLLGVLMIASTTFLTKTTARYLVFGVAYLIVSYNIIDKRIKWLVIGVLTFTSVFAMHGLLVGYTGVWIHMYPGMSPSIPINWAIYSLYINDIVISEMILANLFVFILIFATTYRGFNSGPKRKNQSCSRFEQLNTDQKKAERKEEKEN